MTRHNTIKSDQAADKNLNPSAGMEELCDLPIYVGSILGTKGKNSLLLFMLSYDLFLSHKAKRNLNTSRGDTGPSTLCGKFWKYSAQA